MAGERLNCDIMYYCCLRVLAEVKCFLKASTRSVIVGVRIRDGETRARGGGETSAL